MHNLDRLNNCWENPIGTDGFAFLEFATSRPLELEKQFLALGLKRIAKHKVAEITIYQQNKVRFIVNSTSNTKAGNFTTIHGDSVSAMGFYVKNVAEAIVKVADKGAKLYKSDMVHLELDLPAIYGVGDSLIYLIGPGMNIEDSDQFEIFPVSNKCTAQMDHIDHVTHNLFRGNMQKWAEFYKNIFNFKEIRFFDIEGKLTGLRSRAMTSPCGKIRIPLNESSDDKSQIEEFLHSYNGEGIQHIALSSDNIYEDVELLRNNGIEFLDTTPTYYKKINSRLPNHGENIQQLEKNHILIDGNVDDSSRLLLQIFTKNMLGPVFFEIIQRKGDDGFGEGNFRALFESIEEDQIRRGVLG